MKKQVARKSDMASKKERSRFSKIFGFRKLPKMPEEFNKAYVVDSDTISVSLLRRSGYTIFHRPYFAMWNSTHGKWQLNPHLKRGVDAAPIDDSAISFNEYLDLFESDTR